MTVESIAFAWIAVLGMAMFIMGLAAYNRSKSPKMLLVALGFFAIFIKGAVLSYSLFSDTISVDTLWLTVAVVDTVALVLIFFGIYKR